MATGRFTTPQTAGSVQVTNSGYTVLYTVPNNTYSIFNVSLTNSSASAVTVKLAICTTANVASPLASDFIESLTTVVGYGVFERTGLVAGTGQKVWVSTSGATGTVAVTVYGIETSTV
jgi:hypothetical protein